MKKRENSHTVGGNVNWNNHCGNSIQVSQKLKTELSYDLAIPFLGVYLEKKKAPIQKDTCTPMFIAASFIVAKIQKQPKYPSTDEQIKKCGMHICICLCIHICTYV